MIIFKIVKYFPIIDTSQTVMNVILCYLFLFYDANHIGSDRIGSDRIISCHRISYAIKSYYIISYHIILNDLN